MLSKSKSHCKRSNSQFVTEKNLPWCKKFTNHYVEKVLVYHDQVELTLKVVVDLLGGSGGVAPRPKERPEELLRA